MSDRSLISTAGSFWHSAPEAEFSVAQHLASARQIRQQILNINGARTVSNTLEPYNDLLIEIDRIIGWAELIGNVHPDGAVREAANNAYQQLAGFLNELRLDRGLYEALCQVPLEGLDTETARFVEHTLRDYRRSGVDKDESVRRDLSDLFSRLVSTGQEFSKNIREDERFIEVSPDDLAGLPPDFVEKHQPLDGRVKITTAYADYDAFMKYSAREDLRRALYMQFQTRAHPVNQTVLKDLLKLRYRYASLLGYPNWAEYTAEDKMVKTAATISDFIDRVEKMAHPRMQRDLAVLLARKRQEQPAAEAVNDWDYSYLAKIVREEQFGIDSREIRAYFAYPAVKEGLLSLTEKMFGVQFVKEHNADVWAPEVEVYQVFDDDVLIGRIFLDLFPRKDKYSHVATFPGQTGLNGRQIGQVAFVGNFSGPGQPDKPAFWEHSDVVTFLHEFGHVMHCLLAYRHHWVSLAGINCQWDFVEVPSQLYEEWAWDAEVLGRFARHISTGQPIPAALVERLRCSSEFGKGLSVNRQMAYARLSLSCHDRDPQALDLLECWQSIVRRYSPFPYEPGTFTYSSFGHLEGYSSMYYCYMWSLALVKDFLTRFRSAGMVDAELAVNYRRKVLQPGGARDGDDLARDFLGRDFSFEAFQKWLEE